MQLQPTCMHWRLGSARRCLETERFGTVPWGHPKITSLATTICWRLVHTYRGHQRESQLKGRWRAAGDVAALLGRLATETRVDQSMG